MAGDAVADLMVKISGDASGLRNALKGVQGDLKNLSTGTPIKDPLAVMSKDTAQSATIIKGNVDKTNTSLRTLSAASATTAATTSRSGVTTAKAFSNVGKTATGLNRVETALGGMSNGALKSVGAFGRLGSVFSNDIAMVTSMGAETGALAGALIPVAAGAAVVAAGFIFMGATSKTFAGLMGGVVSKFQEFLPWAGKVKDALMSGDFGKAGELIKTGFIDTFNYLKNIDWGSIGQKLVTSLGESFNTIKDAIGSVWDYLKGVDWGGVWNTLVTSIGGVWDSIVSWFGALDWHSIGEQAGTLIGQALVSAFQLAVDLASWFADALAGLINVGGGEAAGTSLGNQASTGFGAAFSGVSEKIQEQLSRIHINWAVILGDVGGIFADVGAIAGAAMAIALVGAIQPFLSFMHIEIKTDGLMDKAMGNLKSDLAGMAGDLKTNVSVTPDLTKFNTQITAATATHREAAITATALTAVANSDLSVFAKQTRVADIIAAAKTDIANSSLDTVTKQQRTAEIDALANTVDADGQLNAVADQQRIATILAHADTAQAMADLMGLTATEYKTIIVRTQNLQAYNAENDLQFTGVTAAGGVFGMQGGGITGKAKLAIIGEAGPEAVIPQKYWGGVAPWVLNSLPKYAGGVTTGGGGGGDNTWDKSLKQTANYAVNLKPINDTAARALNYAIVTTQNAAAANQNTGVANQHLNNITAVGQATNAACNTTADACAATTAACSDNCTTATDGNTSAIAGSCSSMASSCAATAGSCAATAGSCAATAGSCGTTAGCLTSNCASYASGGYVDKPQFAFIGEKEREYIVPESKMGSFGGGHDRHDRYDRHDRGRKGDTYIHVEGVKAEEIAREIARQQRIRDIIML